VHQLDENGRGRVHPARTVRRLGELGVALLVHDAEGEHAADPRRDDSPD
jgi:hypothetical protein